MARTPAAIDCRVLRDAAPAEDAIVCLECVGRLIASPSSAKQPFHLRDVELLHAHDRAHDAIGALSVATQKLRQDTRDDLPGDAELVGEPAALDMLAALRKLLPQRIDFSLVVAIDHERNRGRELVVRAAVQRQESLAVDLEENRHHRALLAGRELAVARRRQNAAVRKDREVVGDRLFGVEIEPETGRDFLLGHRRLLLRQGVKAGQANASGRRVFRPSDYAEVLVGEMVDERAFVDPAEALAASPSLLMPHAYPPVGIIVKRRKPHFATAQARPRQKRRSCRASRAFNSADGRHRIVDDRQNFRARNAGARPDRERVEGRRRHAREPARIGVLRQFARPRARRRTSARRRDRFRRSPRRRGCEGPDRRSPRRRR